jgi:predicted AAA+ superfamily ATPase
MAKRRLRRLASYFPIVAVSGARQAGKTTLLRECFQEYNYVALDLPSIAEQAERNPGQFLAENPRPLLVDEVQYAPDLFRHLKMIVDRARHQMGQYVITGNQHFTLVKGVAESLAGRVGLLELENLSLQEIRQHISIGTSALALLPVLVRGQFPEPWRMPDFPIREFFSAYVATYLERDVRQILNVSSLRDFERFLRILAARSGGMLNKSDVARDVGVSVKAVGDWLSVLQASGQIVLLEPWHSNISKRMVKTSKVYFRDSGLLCYLLNLTEQTAAGSPLMGAVWETFVFSELCKLNAVLDETVNFWYYRDQRAREIDFILEAGGRLSFLEAKWQEHPTRRDAQHLTTVSHELEEQQGPWRPGPHFVVATPNNRFPVTDGIEAVAPQHLQQVLETVVGA